VTLRLAVNQHPLEFQFVIDELRWGKPPLIGDLDVLENVDAAGIASLLLRPSF
jgi:hypothetical protein